MYRIAVCDDDALHRKYIIDTIRLRGDADDFAVGEFEGGEAFLSADCKPLPFDIVLMDIKLTGENGIEVCKRLCDENPDCQIIFVSGYRSYAIEAHDVDHVWYVYKPEIRAKLPLALDRAIKNIENNRGGRIAVKSKGVVAHLPIRDILYFEQKGRIANVVTKRGVYTEYRKIGEYADELAGANFVQCHKSFVVNMDEAATIRRTSIEMSDGRDISVSRTFSGNVERWIAGRSHRAPARGGAAQKTLRSGDEA